jgi:propanol-preferring alcohol dehydrogenase
MVLEAQSIGPASSHPLHERDVPDAAPSPGELLLRVAACGVCRTDLQLCDGDLPARSLPIVPGHQIVGHVEAVGANVEGWSKGDRAGVAWLASTCGECRQCRRGRENLCERATFTGWDRHGGYATYALARAGFALRLPEAFDEVSAAPLLCGGVIGYRALLRAGVDGAGGTSVDGMRVGLYGFGASALIALQVARFWGCRIYVATRNPVERDRAIALGAEWAGGYDETPPVKLDAAVTFAPAGEVVHRALMALDRGATVAINAIHLDGLPAMPYADLWWERSIASVANFTRADARALLDLAARIPIRTEVEAHPLADANVALTRLRAGHVGGAAVLIP